MGQDGGEHGRGDGDGQQAGQQHRPEQPGRDGTGPPTGQQSAGDRLQRPAGPVPGHVEAVGQALAEGWVIGQPQEPLPVVAVPGGDLEFQVPTPLRPGRRGSSA
jgi:hypothetical protein